MTFTLLARSADGKQTAIGIATVSMGVGGSCPYVARDGTVIVTQAFTYPRLGMEATRLVEAGAPLPSVLSTLRGLDPQFSFRQVGILRPDGSHIVHTGSDNSAYAGHYAARDCVALGNVLTGAEVLTAMVEAFVQSPGDLAERVMVALEAGRDSGGQTRDGRHLAERSAYIRVVYPDDLSDLDLRVDIHPRAIAELRRQLDVYRPYVALRRLIALDPRNRPNSVEWEQEHLTRHPPPPQYTD